MNLNFDKPMYDMKSIKSLLVAIVFFKWRYKKKIFKHSFVHTDLKKTTSNCRRKPNIFNQTDGKHIRDSVENKYNASSGI